MSAAIDFEDAVNTHWLRLARYEAGVDRRALALLREMERELVALLANTELTQAQSTRATLMLAQARERIAQGYVAINRQMQIDLDGLSGAEARWAATQMQAATQLPPTLIQTATVTAAAALEIRGQPIAEWLGKQAQGLQNRFTDSVRLGISLGETNQQIVNRVRGTRANGYKDGIFAQSRREAFALVRSAVQTTANKALTDSYKANDDLIKAVVWVSTLDGRTSEVCIARDGLKYTTDGQPIGHSLPWLGGPGAAHWNCRSASVPEYKSWRDLGIPIDDIPPESRASMDGVVPGGTTYAEWLRGKGEAFQNEVLGKGKAELWRDGRISLRDLTNDLGRPLTLEQLEAMG